MVEYKTMKLKLNILFNGAANIINVLFGFFATPIILQNYGAELFGIYSLILMFSGYFAFMDFGIDMSVIKFIAEADKENNKKDINETITNALLFLIIIGITLFLIIVFINNFIGIIFNINEEYLSLAKKMFLSVALYNLFFWPSKLAINIYQGLQKYYFVTINNLLKALFSLVGIVLIYKYNISLLYFLNIILYSRVLSQIILWVIYFINYKYSFEFNFNKLKEMLSFSWLIFWQKILGILVYQTDKLIISIFLPVANLSYYEFASKLHNLPKMLNGVIGAPFMPKASEKINDTLTLKKIIFKGSYFSVGIITGVVITLILFMKDFYFLWLGEEYIAYAYLAQIFVSYWFFNSHTGVLSSILIGIGKTRINFKYSLFATIINLILSVILVNYFGVLGVILGTVITSILGFPIYLYVVFRNIKLNFIKYIKKIIFKQIIFILIFMIIGKFYNSNIIIDNYLQLFLYSGIFLILFYLVYFLKEIHMKGKDIIDYYM